MIEENEKGKSEYLERLFAAALVLGVVVIPILVVLIVSGVGFLQIVIFLTVLALVSGFIVVGYNERVRGGYRKPRRKSNRNARRAKWLDLEHKHGKGNLKCPYCWAHMPRLDRTVQLDHKIPVSEGGGDDYDNLHLICINCNGEKSDLYSHKAFMDMMAPERQKRQREGRQAGS